MPKDARLTIRITDELDAWLALEAAKRGLDKAAFARMALFERMNGPALSSTQSYVLRPGEALNPETGEMRPAMPAEPVDLDALVSQTVQEAEAAGLTAVPAEPEQLHPEASGVRSLFRRPTPFTQALPGFLGGQ